MDFYVDENWILQPLGLTVLRDSKIPILPPVEEYTEQIPGRPGAYSFGCDLAPYPVELHCIAKVSRAEWPAKQLEIASALNPLKGEYTLGFADFPEQVLYVESIGDIVPTNYVDGREFWIIFKNNQAIKLSSAENTLTGSGLAANNGNNETPCVVEIVGLVTNPSVVINGETMTYTGTVTASDKLVIDTERMTVTFNGANAMANYNKVFPKLAVGDNVVTAASGGTTIVRWLNRWF